MKHLRLALTALFLLPLCLLAETELPEVWEVGDGEGGTFLIKLSESHFAQTNYHKGETSYLGEVGYWHRHGNVTTVLYNSGWADKIVRNQDGTFTKYGYSPTTALDAEKPSNVSTAYQRDDQPLFEPVDAEKFIGVWKLEDENGDVFYLETKADRTARSSYSGGPEGVFGETGVWRHEGNRILVAYNSGWIDILVYGGGEVKKYSYAPGQVFGGKFDNVSSAERVDPKEAKIRRPIGQ